MPAELLHLPEDVLLIVLRSTGSRALALAAMTCRRLKLAQDALARTPAFASGMVTSTASTSLATDAVKACNIARARLPSAVAVDFALLFVCGYSAKRAKGPTLDPLTSAAKALSDRLPAGTAVLGMYGAGIIGVLEDGTPLEIDPLSRDRGVSVLVGRLPGAEIVPFCLPDNREKFEEADLHQWAGLPPGIDPRLVLLLVRNAPTCITVAHPTKGFISKLKAAYPGVAVAGGLSSGKNRVVCYGRRPLGKKRGRGNGNGNGGVWSGNGAGSQPLLPTAPHCAGLAFCARAPSPPEDAGAPSSSAAPNGPTAPGQPLLSSGFEAGAVAIQGLGPIGRPWSGLRILRNVEEPFAAAGVAEEMVTLEPLGDADAFESEFTSRTSEFEGDVWVAFFLSPDPQSFGFDEATAAGQPVVVAEGPSQTAYMDLANDAAVERKVYDMYVRDSERALLDEMMRAEAAGRALCCQLLSLQSFRTARAMETVLAPRLACGGSNLGAPAAEAPPALKARDSELSSGLEAARAAVLFSCTARGEVLHADSPSCKAQWLAVAAGAADPDGAANSSGADDGLSTTPHFPLAGVFCDGEFGPDVRGGDFGTSWGAAPSAGSRGHAGSDTSRYDSEAGEHVQLDSSQLQPTRARLLSHTSVVAFLNASSS